MNEDEGMTFLPMFLYPDIIYCFSLSDLGSKDLNDYKNSKTYSYHKSGWLKPLFSHSLTGSNFCIAKGEYSKSQSVNNPFHKPQIILEKPVKIRSSHCTCIVDMGERCNHVAAAKFRVEAAVCPGLTNPSCTSSANKCKKDIKSTKIKGLNLDIEKILHSVVKRKDHSQPAQRKI